MKKIKLCVICGKPSNTARGIICEARGPCRSEIQRRNIQKEFARHGGQITQFRKTNGMNRPEVRALVSTKLRAMGWRPPVVAGNGRGPTIHQLALASALGWPMEVPIPTRKRGGGYPTCYKVDIGNAALKVAVEVDGNSHRTIIRKAEDMKKDALLVSLGWKVLRFSNQEVAESLSACVQRVLSTISKSPTAIPTPPTAS